MYTVSYEILCPDLYEIQYFDSKLFKKSFESEREANQFAHKITHQIDARNIKITNNKTGMSRRAH